MKVHHTPGGGSSLVLGGDQSEQTAVAEPTPVVEDKKEGEGEEETKNEQEAKQGVEEEQSSAAPEVAAVKDNIFSDGAAPSSAPHTSVKVHNPPGGKSSITF